MKLKRIFAFNLVAAITTVFCFVTFQANVTAIASDNSHTVMTMLKHEPRFRVRRQTGQKNRGFFPMLSNFISETRNDTMRAFNEISDLVSKLIIPVKQGIQLNYTAPASSRELPENVTTTEAPYVINQQEFIRILRRNLRGLARVFNMESRKAIEDSNNNVRILRKQFVDAVRPYITSNNTT